MRSIRKYQNKSVRFAIVLFLGVVVLMGLKYSIDKSNIRNLVLETIQEGISPEALIVFVFSESESEKLNWKKNHEFELNGEMYDVVESNTENDSIHYICFHDTKETKYKRRFYKLLRDLLLPESDNKSDQNKTQKLVKIQFFQPIVPLVRSCLDSFRKNSFVYEDSYSFLAIGPNSPPPKI